MRFVPDGPDIPNPLIRKWREGSVLFLTGAGVSVPSSLPLFEGLALDVYKVLNDELYDVLKEVRQRKTPAARQRILKKAQLTPSRQVEAALFLDKQFDRFFPLWRSDLIPIRMDGPRRATSAMRSRKY